MSKPKITIAEGTRVYVVAHLLRWDSREVVAFLRALGYNAKGASSRVPYDLAMYLINFDSRDL